MTYCDQEEEKKKNKLAKKKFLKWQNTDNEKDSRIY